MRILQVGLQRLPSNAGMPEEFVLQCQEALAQKIAAIRGSDCPAAVALEEFRQRKAQGEPVLLFFLRGRWLVGTQASLAEARAAAATPGRRATAGVEAA